MNKTIAVLANTAKAEALRQTRRIMDWAKRRGHRIVLDNELITRVGLKTAEAKKYRGNPKKCDIILTLGGDGFLLHTARKLYPCPVPILAINVGSLGFNAQAPPQRTYQLLEKFLKGKARTQMRLIMLASVYRGRRKVFSSPALNDIVITKQMKSRIVNLELRVNGTYVNKYRADALIVSTPTGSTAYNLAAGGPILHPELEAIVVTSSCPHTITDRPLILSANSELEVIYEECKDREAAAITTDGQRWQALRSGDRVKIVRADEPLRLVLNPDWDYFATLRKKLRWGGSLDV